tara:strand:- start:706 stop:1113 length:408 start_codon:yes stop_codon:yes gene_type:complete
MTYIPVEVFIECIQTSGIKDRYEYYELHDRGIVPIDLMPKKPSYAYKSSYHLSPEAKAYQRAYQQSPDVRAHRKAYYNTPEAKAKQKAYYNTPEYRAYQRARHQRPDVRARKKTEARARYLQEKLSKKLASKHTK